MATDVVPATDRGLAYGDGVFRTLAVRGHRPTHWDRQYAKLTSDCGRLRISCPPPDVLHGDVMAVSAGRPDAAVKIIITRGAGERGYSIPRAPHPSRVVIASPLPAYPDAYAREGISAFLCSTRLGTQPALAGVKHLNRLENVLARAEWDSDAYMEGILRDEAGNVIGGTMTNLFIVEGNRLYTPALERCGVAGLTRDLILEGAAQERVPCQVEAMSFERVMESDEVFLVNSLIGVWPVRSIAGREVRTGPMAHRTRMWLDERGAPG